LPSRCLFDPFWWAGVLGFCRTISRKGRSPSPNPNPPSKLLPDIHLSSLLSFPGFLDVALFFIPLFCVLGVAPKAYLLPPTMGHQFHLHFWDFGCSIFCVYTMFPPCTGTLLWQLVSSTGWPPWASFFGSFRVCAH